MTPIEKEEIISKILELEFEITSSIINGHKPSIDDKYQNKRNELKLLRCILFGYKSSYCKKTK